MPTEQTTPARQAAPTDAAPGGWVIAQTEPGRPAVVEPGRREVTFGELGEAANRVANALRAAGLAAGDVVAVVLHNSVEYYELLWATGQIGLYLVPVNTHLAPPEVEYIVQNSKAKAVIAHQDLAAGLEPVRASLPSLLLAVDGAPQGWSDYEAFKAAGDPGAPPDRVAGTVMGYTSGTTGRPRGVVRPFQAIEPELMIPNYVHFMSAFGIRPGSGVHLVCAPLYHSAPLNISLQLLHLGHRVVVHRRFDAEEVLRDIERYKVTTSQLVPTHLHRMLRLGAEVLDRYDTSSLQALLVAGAPFGVEAKKAALDQFGPVIWEYLAGTEGFVAISSPQDAITHPGTVGRPFLSAKILDAVGEPVPTGEVGVIHFQMMSSFKYLNDPDKTAASVRSDGFATAGDLGRFDEDGYLYLLDRRDDLIISGGLNVYPAELEQRLLQHPAVADVAVVGAPDPEWGHRVVAVVQLEPGAEPGPDLEAELDRHCRAALAGQKCPRRYEFRQTLPRTPAGKLLRRVLREAL